MPSRDVSLQVHAWEPSKYCTSNDCFGDIRGTAGRGMTGPRVEGSIAFGINEPAPAARVRINSKPTVYRTQSFTIELRTPRRL